MDSTPADAPKPASAVRGLLISLVVLLLMVAVCEGAARIKWTRDELDPYSRNLADARITAHPYLAYANKRDFDKPATPESPQQVSHNSHGFRGPEFAWEKPDGVFRVLCLGGSSTYGFGPSSDATTWPVKLEEHLSAALPGREIEVINGGCQGYSTFESLINLELRGIDLRPDLVVVYHAINDMRCALYPNVQRDNTHWRAVWPVEWANPTQELLEKSFLFLAWRRHMTDWWETRQNLGAYVIRDFGKYTDDYAQPDEGDLGFRNIHRNLVNIVEIARRHGAATLLVQQGLEVNGELYRAASKDLQLAGMARLVEITNAVGAETQSPVLDAKSVLEAAQAGGADVFTNDVHLTDEGADLLARTLADGIVNLGLAD